MLRLDILFDVAMVVYVRSAECKGMEINYFAFFGNHWDPLDLAPSIDSAESILITRMLEQLDLILDAPECYVLARGFLRDGVPLSMSQPAALVIEKYFIWCFFTAKVSPLRARIEDAWGFLDYFKKPPKSLMRSVGTCKRFIRINNCAALNPKWRPYKDHLSESRDYTRQVLNRFFAHIASRVGYTIYISEKTTNETHLQALSGEALRNLANKYFTAFSEQNFDKVIGLPVRRTSYEKKLFLLATCFLLDISYKDLSSESSFFSMACFSRDHQNIWRIRIQGKGKLIVRILPEAYVEVLYRYRTFLGLCQIPNQEELLPIFKSPHALLHVLRSLPMFDFMTMTPRMLLKKIVRSSPHYAIDNLNMHTPCPHDSSITQKEGQVLRKIRRVKNIAPQIYNKIITEGEQPRCSIPPPPLFFCADGNNRKIAPVDTFEVGTTLSKCVKLSHADIDTLVHFGAYANSDSGMRSRLKVRAYEKLALWCIFVRGISIASLTECDAKQFYVFCVNPPSNWCCVANVQRKSSTTHIISKHWRPFKLLPEDIVAKSYRAGKIMEWCDAVQQELLSYGLISANAFRSLSRELWSLKFH
jgi:hypothetical protein